MKRCIKFFLLSLSLITLCAVFSQQSKALNQSYNWSYYGDECSVYFGARLEKLLSLKNTKVINHAVYQYQAPQDGNPACYRVVSYFDSEAAMNAATEIHLQDEIEGIPVSAVQLGYDPEEDVFTEPNARYLPPVAEAVTKITFPKHVKVLGPYTFSCLPCLKNYKIPKSAQTLDRAFYRQWNLTKITIPQNVARICDETFFACVNLDRIVIKGNLKQIGRAAFYGCEKLISIQLPESLRRIESEAFTDCPLSKITIPAGCRLYKRPFGNSPLLKKITFAEQNEAFALPNQVLAESKKLTTIIFPKNANRIEVGNLACANCTSLKKIVNAENITVIGKKAFKGCTSLEKFTISAKVKSVGAGVFAGTGLKKLIVSGTKKAFLSENGSAFLKTLPANCKIYVKNNKMKRAFVDAGWEGKILINERLS